MPPLCNNNAMTNQPIDLDDLNIIDDDTTALYYNTFLAAFARLLPDDTILAITTDRTTARDFIASLAYDPDASTESPADAIIPAYQSHIDAFYALDDYDLYTDLIYAIIDADRAPHLPADCNPLDLYLD
jgi:hypothetical protein